LNWQQVITLTDRVDYLANLSNNLCYSLAVEKLLGLEVPPKAQFLRVLLAELTRINSHLVWLGTHALDLGAMTMFFLTFREREDLLRIFEMFSGQRLMTSYIRPGGLALDPPRGWQKPVRAFLDDFPSKIDEYESLLNANPIWLQRTQGIGILPVEEMLEIGITGPLIRAAGIPLDARKMTPYSSYEKFDFKVPTETGNDVFARYTVRMAEMRESLKIVRQALEGMPEGPTRAEAHRVVLPEREKMKTQMEALIYHFKIVTEGIAVPEGEVFQVVESPRGELGYYVVSDGSGKPLRVHMRTPSFGNLQGLPNLVEKRQISDSIAIMGSLDFVLGDCDR
jgi:NADH-quinone oxidoreductase subunit D